MKASKLNILGVGCGHNGGACLLRGDKIVSAIQEERLTGRKREPVSATYPILSINYCLNHAGISIGKLDAVAVVSDDEKNFGAFSINPALYGLEKVPIFRVGHHEAHAASAFCWSGFSEATALVIDGAGDHVSTLSTKEQSAVKYWQGKHLETISVYCLSSEGIFPVEKHLGSSFGELFPEKGLPSFRSLGGMYSSAAYLIFGSFFDAGKVMGLAPYGKITLPYTDFFSFDEAKGFIFNDILTNKYYRWHKWPSNQEEFQNFAASTQAALENALSILVQRVRKLSSKNNLCYSGGVALNSIANEHVIMKSGYKGVFIPPAADDSGLSVGAAYLAHWKMTGKLTSRRLLNDAHGKAYSSSEIKEAVEASGAVKILHKGNIVEKAAELLAQNKIIGFFQGCSELGPRALGQRSIICDPRMADAKERLNHSIKFRESFRPFAPAILEEKSGEWFNATETNHSGIDSPFMLRICSFKREKRAEVPAVVHVDGSGRLQTLTSEATPLLYELVKAFEQRTGVPLLLNTSFNARGEPIVETPFDAISCFLFTGLDYCVIGDYLLGKDDGFSTVYHLYPRLSEKAFFTGVKYADDCLAHHTGDKELKAVYNVFTPWGHTIQYIPASFLYIFPYVNGRRTFGYICDRYLRQKQELVDFITPGNLARLHRAGIIKFSCNY